MRIAGKRVVDAVTPLKINISSLDARLGKNKDPGACAAARAIIRSVKDAKGARVHLGRVYIEQNDKWVRYITPQALKIEIVSFDRGTNSAYAEGSYTLYPPSPAERLAARKHKPGPKATRHAHKKVARINHRIEGVRQHGANK